MPMTLEDLGWNAAFEKEFAPYDREGWKPARLIRDNKITYGALLGDGEEMEVTMSAGFTTTLRRMPNCPRWATGSRWNLAAKTARR